MTTPPSQWPDPTGPSGPTWPSPGDPTPAPPPVTPEYQPVAPAHAPTGYGPVPGYGPQPYVVVRRTNGLALAAMICSLVGFGTCFTFPVGAILGHVALRQIRATGEEGAGYAKTGIIVGWIGTAVGIALCAGWILLLATAMNEGPVPD